MSLAEFPSTETDNFVYFYKSRGHNAWMPGEILLEMELVRDIIGLNIVSKFGDDEAKTV